MSHYIDTPTLLIDAIYATPDSFRQPLSPMIIFFHIERQTPRHYA
jgi:hypothetical protein